MGIFEDWAKRYAGIRWLIIATGCLALVLLLLTQFASIRDWFLVTEKRYQIQLEASPTHLMLGRIEGPYVATTEDENRLTRDQAIQWTVTKLEEFSKYRNFAASGAESYGLSIYQNWLFLEKSTSGPAYMYAITPVDLVRDWRMYQGIKDIRLGAPQAPILGQLARIVHRLVPGQGPGIDLDRYFSTPVWVQEGRLVLTFHGSNGQFKGEIVTIKSSTDGSYFFEDGSTLRSIDIEIRPARIAILATASSGPVGAEFETRVKSEFADSQVLEMSTEQIDDLDSFASLATRMREIPLGDRREKLLDQMAIDFVVQIRVQEFEEKRMMQWNDLLSN